MLKRQVSGISLIDSNRPFAPLSVALLTTVIVLFAVGVRYPDLAAEDASGGATGTLGHSAREAAPHLCMGASPAVRRAAAPCHTLCD